MSHDNDNPIDPDISDLYQSTRSDEPGATLDAAILAEAEAAVETKRKRPAWIAPVGLAATVLLGVNLAVNRSSSIIAHGVEKIKANRIDTAAQ